MKKAVRYLKLYLVVAMLLLAACGSDETIEETTDAGDSASAATPADDAGSDGGDDNGASVSGLADDGDDSDGDMISVSSLDDIPQVCRDLMADFLKDLEPLVSPIDWDNATVAEFEAISAEFDARAEQFDADSDAAGECDNLDMDDEESFDLLVEFAQQEAPGTAGFFNFLAQFVEAATGAVGGTAAGDGFETCDDAIAFMDGLMENYDSMEDVPISELTTMAEIASVIFTCTPEQMTYFDSPEVNAFFDDFFG